MSLPAITLVCGIDFRTLQQLEVSHRTWRLHQKQIYSWSWVVFYDCCCPAFTSHLLADLVRRGVVAEQTRFVPWPQLVGGNSRRPKYEHQRERMLSGFPYVAAAHVETPWWAKIDCDALALRSARWPQEEWFAPDECGVVPVTVAPGWHYTKGQNFLGRLEEWGDKTVLSQYPRLNIPFDPTHLRVPHKRWCSWNSFYETDWTKSFVGLLADSGLEAGTLPIPSQDSTMWYAAERAGLLVNKVNMKKHGWTNVPKLANLIETAQAVMRGEQREVSADA